MAQIDDMGWATKTIKSALTELNHYSENIHKKEIEEAWDRIYTYIELNYYAPKCCNVETIR
tara:strand:- start:119 stop:301 length:183 start_codon:yes stop_codon:yes gene_type:complete